LNRFFRAEITENRTLTNKNNLLTVRPLDPVICPSPGQFYMIEVCDTCDPLLKRPFSYIRKTRESIQFVYAVKGKGTSLMKDFKRGKVINMVGPLGNGYPAPGDNYIPLLIAGGIGMASLFPLVESLRTKSFLIYGARTRDELVMMDELEKSGAETITCTDDCSFGKEGLVTDILEDFLASHPAAATPYLIYACGPKPMLKALAKIAGKRNIRGYVSLEENMACGFSACLGCAVKTKLGYQRVCKEGPIFPIEAIGWI
jgi:dihydroorotate dehydrogenase electron transfer subunit